MSDRNLEKMALSPLTIVTRYLVRSGTHFNNVRRRLTRWNVVWSSMILIALWGSVVFAQEFRTLRPIPRPPVEEPRADGESKVSGKFIPVDRRELDKTIRELVAKWNTPEFESVLAETLFDRTRVEDTMRTNVLRHARLRVLSVQGVQILNQQVVPDPSGLPIQTVVSTVSATVRAQAEFNDPSMGFQRQEGVNELILQDTQQMLK